MLYFVCVVSLYIYIYIYIYIMCLCHPLLVLFYCPFGYAHHSRQWVLARLSTAIVVLAQPHNEPQILCYVVLFLSQFVILVFSFDYYACKFFFCNVYFRHNRAYFISLIFKVMSPSVCILSTCSLLPS